ncbi:MAG TPA: HAMP domain-containing protein, partial [bacterium]|nr:HAMP domain-containing protein [bacterium]
MAGKKRTSIKAEITFFIILLMVIVTGSLGYFILEAQKQSLTTEVKLRGLSIAKNMANNMADFILTDDELSVMRIITDTMNNTGVVYAFFVDEKNVIKAHNKIEMFGTAFSEPEAREIIETEPYAISVYGGKGGRIIDFSAPVVAKGRLTLGSVRLGISHSLIDNVINAAYVKAAIIALIALVLGIAGAFFLGAAITRPIGTLAQGAKIIGTGNLAHTIKINSNNELGELASVFNAMTGDLKKAQEAAIQQQRLERELELARDIQLSLIPKDIEKIKGYEVAAYYLAAKEVGGDYYDVMRLNDDKFGFVVGDVSGKGVPAALVMTMARSVLHADARGLFDKPSSETLKRLNSTVSKDIKDGMFITLFYGILDIKKNVLNISSAGHNDTVVY